MKGYSDLFSYNRKTIESNNVEMSKAVAKTEENKFPIDLQLFASKHIKTTRGEKLLKQISNVKLKNFVSQVFRKNAEIGDGGLADAIKEQIKTGKLVRNKDHIIKGRERLVNLGRILKNERLTKRERKIASKLYKEIDNALKEIK